MNQLMRLLKEEDGQALTEYGLLVGLIAIAVIAVLGTVGTKLDTLFESIATALTPTP
ncbi:Flp family type IVb pilin [Paenisporosarcina sp. TG20]|uniref:Flp family type IVb pilin n=1 Tax=Paenisporosarcina sp. TG20 TaxID=1211706 RepID=UPI0002F4D5B7|nr:Flp family type IVb pilin [Paenisporosarcina sp. TG20]